MIELGLAGLAYLHIKAYKTYFIKTLCLYTITFLLKRIMKSMGDKEKADVLGLSGYCLTLVSILDYLQAVSSNGIQR